jgi:glycosyltransferase involved in cell wall biosynthesis
MLMRRSRPVARAAVNLKPRRGSWGGANQWTSQLVRWLEFNGWEVRFDLAQKPDAVVMTHTGLVAGTTFGADEVEAAKKRWPELKCLHRINDNDIRKGTSEMDPFLAQSSRVADHTVFVSGWLRDYHAARWFDARRAHSVIRPGADSRFFHPIGGAAWDGTQPLRLATHHWSNNWNKGFDVYSAIDRLAAGELAGKIELNVIGRWPADLEWKSAKTHPPASGAALAGLLRGCHAYVSASRHEPGAMHVAEGLQCGLPLLFHRDTGGTVEQGRAYGVEIGDSLESSIGELCAQYAVLRKKLLADPPSGSRMAAAYEAILTRLILEA